MKTRSRFNVLSIVFVLFLFLNSCSLFQVPEEIYAESEKSIVGDWKIIETFRNEVDIYNKFDFSEFVIHFGEDNSYKIDNYLPFVVDESGNYFLDDPQYPFHITFMQDGGAVETELNFPIVNGKRQIHLTFSPGCFQNVYVYVLEEINP